MLFGLQRKPDGLYLMLVRSGPALLVYAAGAVDASNIAVWRRRVGEAAAVAAAPGPLIIETSGLEFMSVGAFAVLAEESGGCRRRGIRLWLVSNQPIAGRVVCAAGLETELSFATTVDDALDGMRDDSVSEPEYQR